MKYLMTDFNGKVYTISGGAVTELTGKTRSDLCLAETFRVYGSDDVPTSQQIISLTKPSIYRFSETDEPVARARITSVPEPQCIKAVAELNNPSIKGITQITAIYSGNVKVSFSYDGVNFTMRETMASFLARDVEELYGGLQQNKKIYFKFVLMDENASLTNFVMAYLNE